MGFWDDYDFANGAPFGTFDLDGDGELDIVESGHRLAHYAGLWEEEDQASNLYNDDEISPLGSSNISDLDLDIGLYDANDLDDLAKIYNVPVSYLQARGVELGYFDEEDFENCLDDDSDDYYDDDLDDYYDNDLDTDYDIDYANDYENDNLFQSEIQRKTAILEYVCDWATAYLEKQYGARQVSIDRLLSPNSLIFRDYENQEEEQDYYTYLDLCNFAAQDCQDMTLYNKIYSMLMIVGLIDADDKEIERARFIVNNWNAAIAARNLSPTEGFLFKKAITERFILPMTLPVYSDQSEEDNLDKIIKRIAMRHMEQGIEVWMWIYDNFSEYRQYMKWKDNAEKISCDTFEMFVTEFGDEFYDYLVKNPNTMTEILSKTAYSLPGFHMFTDYLICNKEYDILVLALRFLNKNQRFEPDFVNRIQEELFNSFNNYYITGCSTDEETLENWKYYVAEINIYFKRNKCILVQEDAEYYLKKAKKLIEKLEDQIEDNMQN